MIVPVFTRSDDKKIPYACIVLIALNCLIFFLFQAQDSKIEQEAYFYYHESGLLDIELQAYRKYLSETNAPSVQANLNNKTEDDLLVRRMFSDDKFNELLDNQMIITPENSVFKEWHQKKDRFKTIINKSITHRHGYSPQRNNQTALFTCMFLHGGFMHLLGNMVFLYLAGAIIEIAIGPLLFIPLYLVTGICASALFGIVYPASPGPLVGASGAIAGLMGAYGIIFGLRRIRVFYSLGFYFNYATVPALILFPIWLAQEFFQLYTNENSNVAYVAHIGGLISGISIGAVYKTLLKRKIDALFIKSETKQTVESFLELGQEKLLNFDLPNARRNFQKALELDPGNIQAIRQLYVVDKSSPETEQFHQSAARLMQKFINNSPDEYIEIFEDYKGTTQKPKLNIDMLERLSFLYLSRKEFAKAAPLISTLYKKNPKSTNLPNYLLRLAEGFRHNNKPREAIKCYQVLAKYYPASEEGCVAVEKLQQ